jgi:hypothetical protein
MSLIEITDGDYLNEIIFNYKTQKKLIYLLQKAELYSNKYQCDIQKIKSKENAITIGIHGKGQIYPGNYKLFLLFEVENILLKIASYKNHGNYLQIQVPISYFISQKIKLELETISTKLVIPGFEKSNLIGSKGTILLIEMVDLENLIQNEGIILKDVRIQNEEVEIILNARVEKISKLTEMYKKQLEVSIVKISKSDMERLIQMGLK